MDTSEPGYAQAARVRALGPSRANPRAPRRRRVSLENEGDCSDGGRVGVGPTDSTFPLPMQPSGRPWASKRTPGKLIMSNIIFFMDGEVRNYKGEL